MEKVSRELSTPEVETFSALLAEQESATINKSFKNFFDEAARDRSTFSRHTAGCYAQPEFACNCSFARMTFNEMSALDVAAQSRLEGLDTEPKLQVKFSEHENQSLCNTASFCGIFTEARAGKPPQPKPMSALSG